MSNQSILLELKNIKKSYPVKTGFFSKVKSFVPAVNQVNLTLIQKENVALVGESGCGKTTLARIILRLVSLDEGQISFEGRDITHLHEMRFREYRRHIQMVFQDPYSSLDPRFTVKRILQEAMLLDQNRYRTKQLQYERMKELMNAVHLKEDMLNRYPHEFSGGERQRIAIARALVLNPKLLILDEAVSSLDVLIQDQILKLLNELQAKYELTYLFITHNLKIVKKLCPKIAVMYKGKMVEMANTDEIFKNPLHPYTQELLSAAMNYKVVQRSFDIEISRHVHWVEHTPGHFVLQEWY